MSRTENYNLDLPNINQDIQNETIPNLADNFEVIDKELIKKVQLQKNTLIVNIPSEYETLQDAVDKLSELKTINKSKIILNIKSGHRLTKGLLLTDQDYSHFQITSDDSIVYLDSEFIGVSPSFSTDSNSLFVGESAGMPRLSCLIDMENKHGSGYYATKNSKGHIDENCGVINAGRHGLATVESKIDAQNSIWNGATEMGIRLEQVSEVSAQGSSANNCGDDGVFASRGSTLQFSNARARNAGGSGIRAQRSRIVAMGTDVTGAQGFAAVWSRQESNISFQNGNASNASIRGLYSEEDSKIGAENATVLDCGDLSLSIRRGGIITCTGANHDSIGITKNNLTGMGIIFDENETSQVRSGENSNGYYREYANGDVECWTKINLGVTDFGSGNSGDPYRTASTSWTLPIPMYSPTVTITVNVSRPDESNAIDRAGYGVSRRITDNQTVENIQGIMETNNGGDVIAHIRASGKKGSV